MPINTTLIYLENSGAPRELGRQYGAALAGRFARQWELARGRLKGYKPESVDAIRRRMLARQTQLFPELTEEMRGMAEGAGLPIEHVQLMTFWSAMGNVAEPRGCCSNIAFPSTDSGPLLGKTLDGGPPDPDAAHIVRLVRPDSGHAMLYYGYIGTIWVETGMNDQGLAIGNSSLHFTSHNLDGVNRNVLIRPLLERCGTTEQAIAFLADHPTINRGYHFSILDASGDAAFVERSPSAHSVRRSKREPIFGTNHSIVPHMQAHEREKTPDQRANTVARFERLDALVNAPGFAPSLHSMKAVMACHDRPGAICRHGGEDISHTTSTFIYATRERKMLLAPGNSCDASYQAFGFEPA